MLYWSLPQSVFSFSAKGEDAHTTKHEIFFFHFVKSIYDKEKSEDEESVVFFLTRILLSKIYLAADSSPKSAIYNSLRENRPTRPSITRLSFTRCFLLLRSATFYLLHPDTLLRNTALDKARGGKPKAQKATERKTSKTKEK